MKRRLFLLAAALNVSFRWSFCIRQLNHKNIFYELSGVELSLFKLPRFSFFCWFFQPINCRDNRARTMGVHRRCLWGSRLLADTFKASNENFSRLTKSYMVTSITWQLTSNESSSRTSKSEVNLIIIEFQLWCRSKQQKPQLNVMLKIQFDSLPARCFMSLLM